MNWCCDLWKRRERINPGGGRKKYLKEQMDADVPEKIVARMELKRTRK